MIQADCMLLTANLHPSSANFQLQLSSQASDPKHKLALGTPVKLTVTRDLIVKRHSSLG
jgi:hypothetical protein